MEFHEDLLNWFEANKRDLPWRRTNDPYAIWVSEVMLQQTQVATVIPYFERWMQQFPTVLSLAMADEQEALAVWQGLGYYRRCRMLLEGARWVVANGLPTDAAGWRNVPGVGRYTAGAIASIAQAKAEPLVDGNVERVYSRLAADNSSGSALAKAAWKWAENQIAGVNPADWNQALMELGAVVCRPVEPACVKCPVMRHCEAYREGRVRELPVVVASKPVTNLRHSIWIPKNCEKVGIRKIPDGAWWQGLWEFPWARCGLEAQLHQLTGSGKREPIGSFRHSVTNHRILVEVSLFFCEEPAPDLNWLTLSELDQIPMPAPQRKALAMAIEAMRTQTLGDQ